MAEKKSGLTKLTVVVLVLLLLVVGLAMLMAGLSSARKKSQRAQMSYREGLPLAEYQYKTRPAWDSDLNRMEVADATESTRPPVPRAVVEKYDAEIGLTPKLSIGTARPESIYVADFKATITAQAPRDADGKCQIEMPLPPKIISLAGVDVKVNGDPTKDFALTGRSLVWQGTLSSDTTSEITVAYSAVGKGIYTLEKPSGKIVEHFKTTLVAHQSDIRMLELSLQPSDLKRESGKTTYTWDYERLVVARPIAIDVLGIAAIDRLGELTWLGPVSVFIFGVLIALVALARDPAKLNAWVAVLVVGCFAGAYPMMYFLQDFISLTPAIALASVAVIAVIAWRVISLFGLKHGLFGGVIVPAIIIALTVAATVDARPATQGVLVTVLAVFGLVVSMVLVPRAQANLKAPKEEVVTLPEA